MKFFYFKFDSPKAVTLVELMVVIVLFGLVSAAGYKAFVRSTQTAIKAQKEGVKSRKLQQFFETFRHQIENTVQLPNADATALTLLIPENATLTGSTTSKSCYNPSLDQPQIMGWGLVPYPAHDVARMNTDQTKLSKINTQTFIPDLTDENHDGIRMVHVLSDSQTYALDLSQVTKTHLAVASTPAPFALKTGDYAVISDTRSSDLFRITNIEIVGDTTFIEHDSTKSTWNTSISSDGFSAYGVGQVGGAFIYKVGIATYALDTTTNTLMLDAHFSDDGFNGTDFDNSPRLSLAWSPIVNNISRFQVWYEISDGSTRTPFPNKPSKSFVSCESEPDDPFCGCAHQLGNPGLLNVDIRIQQLDTD